MTINPRKCYNFYLLSFIARSSLFSFKLMQLFTVFAAQKQSKAWASDVEGQG